MKVNYDHKTFIVQATVLKSSEVKSYLPLYTQTLSALLALLLEARLINLKLKNEIKKI